MYSIYHQTMDCIFFFAGQTCECSNAFMCGSPSCVLWCNTVETIHCRRSISSWEMVLNLCIYKFLIIILCAVLYTERIIYFFNECYIGIRMRRNNVVLGGQVIEIFANTAC